MSPDSQDDFAKAMRFLLPWEGGLVDDPDDPGGLTNYGISLRYNPDLGRAGVKGLTPEKAGAIYRVKYWEPSGASRLPWPLSLVVFDTAVNCGVARAKEFLAACPFLGAPGINAQIVINTRRAYYADRIRRAPVKRKYAKGWENRLKALERVVAGSLV